MIVPIDRLVETMRKKPDYYLTFPEIPRDAKILNTRLVEDKRGHITARVRLQSGDFPALKPGQKIPEIHPQIIELEEAEGPSGD